MIETTSKKIFSGQYDLVIALGGGSILDIVKAASVYENSIEAVDNFAERYSGIGNTQLAKSNFARDFDQSSFVGYGFWADQGTNRIYGDVEFGEYGPAMLDHVGFGDDKYLDDDIRKARKSLTGKAQVP